MGIFTAILAALSAAWNAYSRERALYNNPELVKNKLAQQTSAAKDAINKADSVLAIGENASPEAHRKALDDLRRAMS